MATTKTKAQLSTEAETLATSFEYILSGTQVYAPVDYETGDDTVVPPIERKCWRPMDSAAIQQKARTQFDTLFQDRAQSSSFIFMVEQMSTRVETKPWLMLKTDDGLRVLRDDGQLYEPDGMFIQNFLPWKLNESVADKKEVFDVITQWLGGEEEEATSLLHHLATALAPHWSAGRYVLLIGDGRNGKSVLMTLLQDLFGRHNCSGITRQEMSDAEKSLFDLNGKLLNVVFDGQSEFLKDSGREKSLITGESISMRKLYTNEQFIIQTNALFVEGLNQEPKSRDKSSALQARLVRFWFPNKFPDDPAFMARMRSEQMLGALLSLLIDNYVLEQDKAVMLAPTTRSQALWLDHLEDNSLAVQYIVHLEVTEPLGAEATLVDMTLDELVQKFQSWRLQQNDLTVWDKSAVNNMFRHVVHTDRKSHRVAGKTYPVKVRYITRLKQEALVLLSSLKEDSNAITVVDE
jgi:phage/plasmid-associated DNA primase